MSSEIVPQRFVQGRDAYVDRVPMLELFARGEMIKAEIDRDNSRKEVKDRVDPENHIMSFGLGFADGLLNDIRTCADWAREERKRVEG